MNKLVKVDNHKVGPVSRIPEKGTVAYAVWKCLMRDRGCTLNEAAAAAKRAGSSSKNPAQYVRIVMTKLRKYGWEITLTVKGNKRRYKAEPLYPTVQIKHGRPHGSKNRPRPSIKETRQVAQKAAKAETTKKTRRKASKKAEQPVAV